MRALVDAYRAVDNVERRALVTGLSPEPNARLDLGHRGYGDRECSGSGECRGGGRGHDSSAPVVRSGGQVCRAEVTAPVTQFSGWPPGRHRHGSRLRQGKDGLDAAHQADYGDKATDGTLTGGHPGLPAGCRPRPHVSWRYPLSRRRFQRSHVSGMPVRPIEPGQRSRVGGSAPAPRNLKEPGPGRSRTRSAHDAAACARPASASSTQPVRTARHDVPTRPGSTARPGRQLRQQPL